MAGNRAQGLIHGVFPVHKPVEVHSHSGCLRVEATEKRVRHPQRRPGLSFPTTQPPEQPGESKGTLGHR